MPNESKETIIKVPRGTTVKVDGHPVRLKESLCIRESDGNAFCEKHDVLGAVDESLSMMQQDSIRNAAGSIWRFAKHLDDQTKMLIRFQLDKIENVLKETQNKS